MRQKLLGQFGISFPELLIIILLLGIIFLGAAIFAAPQINKAKDTKRKSDLERLKTALYEFFFDVDCFPKSLPECGQPLEYGETIYLDEIPCDPNGTDYGYQSHCSDDCSQWFMLLTNLENKDDGAIKKTGCHLGCGPPDCEYNYGISSSNINLNYGCIEYYVCAPGGSKEGSCEQYDRPSMSRCPIIFENDPTCQNLCSDPENRCRDASGKSVPDKWKECEYN
jgi:type II secretory pathway pseudopilin PulG